MSRSGYTDDHDDDHPIQLWRGAVNRAIKGKRGQAFLREMAAALDEMPVKRLVRGQLKTASGEVCALGCVGVRRGLAMPKLEANEWDDADVCEGMGELFGIADAMAREIQFINDADFAYENTETPEKRYARVRAWVEKKTAALPPKEPAP